MLHLVLTGSAQKASVRVVGMVLVLAPYLHTAQTDWGPSLSLGHTQVTGFLFTSQKCGVETCVQSLCAGSATGAGGFLVLHKAWGPELPSSDHISLVPVTRLLPTLD